MVDPNAGCVSVTFPSNGISYSQVCGRVVGYQYYSTDAADSTIGTNEHNNINSYYVDGHQYYTWISSQTCMDTNGWTP